MNSRSYTENNESQLKSYRKRRGEAELDIRGGVRRERERETNIEIERETNIEIERD